MMENVYILKICNLFINYFDILHLYGNIIQIFINNNVFVKYGINTKNEINSIKCVVLYELCGWQIFGAIYIIYIKWFY